MTEWKFKVECLNCHTVYVWTAGQIVAIPDLGCPNCGMDGKDNFKILEEYK